MPPSSFPGLAALVGDYEAILCDVWGVLHDGQTPHEGAVDALGRARAKGLKVVLLTNAPRPSDAVVEHLSRMGISGAWDAIVSSGDVVRHALAERGVRRALHVGPDRDLRLYGEGIALVDRADEADVVVLAGLVDDRTETPDDYREVMGEVARTGVPVMCANPDVIVERGERLLYCAGALAALVEEAGGTVEQFGKPHPPIYRMALEAACNGAPLPPGRVLAIGDALATDVRGAANEGFDALFVTGGIHGEEFGERAEPDAARIADRLAREGLTARHHAPRLVW